MMSLEIFALAKYLFERKSDGERGKDRNRQQEIFYQLIHPTNAYDSWAQVQPKPTARNSVRPPTCVAGTKH